MEAKATKRRNRDESSEELPEELNFEILLKLPPSGLGRCRCVSKRWNRSLDIEAFMLRHSRSFDGTDLDTSKYLHSMLLSPSPWTSGRFELLTFDYKNNNNNNNDNNNDDNVTKGRKVSGRYVSLPRFLTKFDRCSNIYRGLACFFNRVIKSPSELSTVLYSVRTGDILMLPKTTNYDMSNNDPSMIESMQTSLIVGFDTIREEYVIFRMTSTKAIDNHNWLVSCETLTLGSQLWDRIDEDHMPLSLYHGRGPLEGGEFCLDGVIYWVHEDDFTSDPDGVSHTVGTFDLGRREFRAFDVQEIFPECSFGVSDVCKIGSVRGCPTLFAVREWEHEVLVCQMSDHKKAKASWTRMASIDMRSNWPRRGKILEGRFMLAPLYHEQSDDDDDDELLLRFRFRDHEPLPRFMFEDDESLRRFRFQHLDVLVKGSSLV